MLAGFDGSGFASAAEAGALIGEMQGQHDLTGLGGVGVKRRHGHEEVQVEPSLSPRGFMLATVLN
jgi:hypothetical protein